MKVLKPGDGRKEWSFKTKCTGHGNEGGGCKAVLLIGLSDLFHTHSSHYDGSNEIYTTFKCVECGVLTDLPVGTQVPGDDLPDQAAWEAKQRKKALALEQAAGDWTRP